MPADAAVVGLTDRIFCAMGSKLMAAEQSTFMIDLQQVGMMLSTGKLHHDLYAYWMNLVKAHLQKMALVFLAGL